MRHATLTHVCLRWLLVCCCLLAAGPALAADGLPISLEVDPCVPGDHEQFERLLLLELGTSTTTQPDAGANATQVAITCVDDGISLRVVDPITRKTMHRTLQAAQLNQPGSERLLALSVAEFVLASWVELSLQKPAPVDPIGETPAPELLQAVEQKITEVQKPLPQKPAPEPVSEPTEHFAPTATGSLPQFTDGSDDTRSRLRAGAAFSWTRVLHSDGPAWLGGQLLFAVSLPAHFQVEVAGGAMFGDESSSYGLVTSNRILGRSTFYYSMEGDISLQLGLGYEMSRLSYSVSAKPDSGYYASITSGTTWLGGPMLSTRVALNVGADSDVGLRVDLGMFTTPVELVAEDNGIAVDANGAWVAIAVDLMTGL